MNQSKSSPATGTQVNLIQARDALLAQEAQLLGELDQVRKGIDNINSTIQIVCQILEITPPAASTPTDPPPAASTPTDPPPAASTPTPQRRKPGRKPKAVAPESIDPDPSPAKTEKPASSPAATPTKTTKRRRRSSNPNNWQDYMLADYRSQPLTDVVHSIFETSPEAVFGSSDLISSIFSPEIPKDARTTARDRLLNILSIGVNENKLVRVKAGKYTLAKPA
jgi:hypothetical protein